MLVYEWYSLLAMPKSDSSDSNFCKQIIFYFVSCYMLCFCLKFKNVISFRFFL